MRIVFSLLFILTVFSLKSQRFEVESFKMNPNDLTALRQPRLDYNGSKCALIKVYTSDNISEVRGNIIGEIESSGMEKWIYVEDGTKQLEIVFDNHYPLSLVFENYDYPVLTQQTTYVLKLRETSSSQVAAITGDSTPLSPSVVSQEFTPQMEEANYDLTARTESRLDNNGRLCALIKVYVDDEIVEARGNVVGEIISKGLEKYIYMEHDSKKLELTFKHHFPVKITFDDFLIPSLTQTKTYTLKLFDSTTPQPSTFKVDSFEPHQYIRANDYLNDYGNTLPLVKIRVEDEIINIEGEIIGEIKVKGMEKWIFFKNGATNMRINFKNHEPLPIWFEDYNIPYLKECNFYVLKIK